MRDCLVLLCPGTIQGVETKFPDPLPETRRLETGQLTATMDEKGKEQCDGKT
jgi:hypothetical protein